ncbi:Trypsin and/or DUF1986 domain containing protein [Asbolus verrucosus]|uniref:Trypsin and/or DUF1986 domain containing protein n=1 Tax=Asbolus verrucosus TaxID=1661398 RepID=A0A482W9S2_ASBVE|nr:Trypsin and/or DUF1986 domain containing protein [Asbolus verrucosus]
MFRFITLVLCVSSIWAIPTKIQRAGPGLRIIGGDPARAAQFPFAAAIHTNTKDGTYFCAGTLISDQWIVTAGQCVDGALLFIIRLGSNSLSANDPNAMRLSTDSYVLHPLYNPETYENDIGVIKFRLPITFTEYIKPIDVLASTPVPSGSTVIALGWGQTSDEEAGLVDDLQYVFLTILTNEECRLFFGNQINDNQVCVEGNYNEGTCMGDSGSPLIQYGASGVTYLVGVSSFLSGNGCESTDPSESRIIGGNPARAGQFPFIAAIHIATNSGTYFCSGTLINNQWVLTAGQCVDGALLLTIRLGSNSLEGNDPNALRLATDTYTLHPEYNPDTLDNDIAVIKFRLPITFTESAGLVDELNYVIVTTLSNEECRIFFGSQITDNMVCVDGNYNEGVRIIGGDDANAGEFPFAAAIYTTTQSGTYFCGGTLLSNQWIITAGSCVRRVLLFTIRLGSQDLNSNSPEVVRVSTDNYVLHPDFNPDTLENDIGLIKLRMPVTFTDYIQAINLPVRDVLQYAEVTAIGWGQTSDTNPGIVNTLQKVVVSALSNEECRLSFGIQVTDNMVCVEGNYNQGACKGDSGTPLIQYVNIHQATIVGVMSFISTNGCESTDPSGYTRIFPYLEWIRNVTEIA